MVVMLHPNTQVSRWSGFDLRARGPIRARDTELQSVPLNQPSQSPYGIG